MLIYRWWRSRTLRRGRRQLKEWKRRNNQKKIEKILLNLILRTKKLI